MEMHKSFATCASQYSWSTVIENSLNGEEIWRYGAVMEFKYKRPYLVMMIHVLNY